MEVADKGKHTYSVTYPCRVPVWWGRYGEAAKHADVPGVTGRRVILRIPKKFTRLERILARLFRAPREVRRPLDQMNSMLWELSNGQRTFEEVCEHMNAAFQEDIAPVVDRTAAGIDALKRRNLMTTLNEEFSQKWCIQPGQVPPHQTLSELGQEFTIDSQPIEGDGLSLIHISEPTRPY